MNRSQVIRISRRLAGCSVRMLRGLPKSFLRNNLRVLAYKFSSSQFGQLATSTIDCARDRVWGRKSFSATRAKMTWKTDTRNLNFQNTFPSSSLAGPGRFNEKFNRVSMATEEQKGPQTFPKKYVSYGNKIENVENKEENCRWGRVAQLLIPRAPYSE